MTPTAAIVSLLVAAIIFGVWGAVRTNQAVQCPTVGKPCAQDAACCRDAP